MTDRAWLALLVAGMVAALVTVIALAAMLVLDS